MRGQAKPAEHFPFAGRKRPEGRQLVFRVDLAKRLDTSDLPSGAPVLGSWCSGCDASFAALAGGDEAKLCEFLLGGCGDSVAVRFALGEDMPGQRDEFSRDGDDGDIVPFAFFDAQVEVLYGAGRLVEAVGGLDSDPAAVRAAALGDPSQEAVLARLGDAAGEAEVRGQMLGEGNRAMSPMAASSETAAM